MTEFAGTFDLVESKDMDKFARVALASKYINIPNLEHTEFPKNVKWINFIKNLHLHYLW
jgi:hypothetical protein